jgi:thymidine kinase
MSEVKGYLKIITGPMFSSKTTHALSELTALKYAGNRCLYINHAGDVRDETFSSHFLEKCKLTDITLIKTDNLESLAGCVAKYDVICVDESQFFPNLKSIILNWVETMKKHVILAGLLIKFNREPFGELLSLIPYADSHEMLTAYCVMCRDKSTKALFTYRKDAYDSDIVIGGEDKYRSICRGCYLKNMK